MAISTYVQQLTQPLISDLQMELASGDRVALNHTFVLAPGMAGVGANDNGDRAPDSDYVVRSGDEIPQIYSVTVPGLLTETSPTAMLERLDLFDRQLAQCRKLWRGDRAFLYIHYALLPQPTMHQGWMACDVTPVFRLARIGWFKPDGVTKVFG